MKTKLNEDTRVKMAVYKPVFDKVLKSVADLLCLDSQDIGKRNRKGIYVKARKLVFVLTYEFTRKKCPLTLIGYMMNPSSPYAHSSVSLAISNYIEIMNIKKPKSRIYVNRQMRDEDWSLKISVFLRKNSDTGLWLEDFSISSGNFLN